MKKMRILVALTFVFILCVTAVSALEFTDIDENDGRAAAVYKMQEKGYIQGFEDGTFRPEASLTRAELVTIINKMYGYTVPAENIFTDISEKDWYYSDVLIGVQAGYIKGMGDGTFKPSDKVTREQVCVMLNSILNTQLLPFTDKVTDKVSDWARDSVEKLLSNRLFTLEDGGKFRATEPMTRIEACEALAKCIVEVDENFGVIEIEDIARAELEKRLRNIVTILNEKVIPACSAEDNKRVASMIAENMQNYADDPSFDYKAATKATFDVYKTVPKERRDEMREHIYKYVDTDDLILFYEIFYDSDINSVIRGE